MIFCIHCEKEIEEINAPEGETIEVRTGYIIKQGSGIDFQAEEGEFYHSACYWESKKKQIVGFMQNAKNTDTITLSPEKIGAIRLVDSLCNAGKITNKEAVLIIDAIRNNTYEFFTKENTTIDLSGSIFKSENIKCIDLTVNNSKSLKCLKTGAINRFGKMKELSCLEYLKTDHRDLFNPDFSTKDFCKNCSPGAKQRRNKRFLRTFYKEQEKVLLF